MGGGNRLTILRTKRLNHGVVIGALGATITRTMNLNETNILKFN